MAAPRPEEMTREEQWAHIASEMEALTLESKRIVEQRRAGIAAFAARTRARPFTQFWSVSTTDAPITMAAAAGDAGRLEELLLQGVDPEDPDDGGVPPLLLACDFGIGDEKPTPGHIECVELLLDAGASPHWGAWEGEPTPLHLASIGGPGAVEMVCLLLDAGADVNAESDKSTPLVFACGLNCAHPDTIEELLWAGAAVDARGAKCSPLEELMGGSMDQRRQRIVPLLLRAGASIPIQTLESFRWTSWGRPPVAKAVYSYLQRILDTPGGFDSYVQIHLRALAGMLAPKLGLPTELARIVVEFWHEHLGFYEVPYDLMVRADRDAALPAALADAQRILAHERFLRSIPPDRRRAMEAESQRLRDARAEAAAHQRRGDFVEAQRAMHRAIPPEVLQAMNRESLGGL